MSTVRVDTVSRVIVSVVMGMAYKVRHTLRLSTVIASEHSQSDSQSGHSEHCGHGIEGEGVRMVKLSNSKRKESKTSKATVSTVSTASMHTFAFSTSLYILVAFNNFNSIISLCNSASL